MSETQAILQANQWDLRKVKKEADWALSSAGVSANVRPLSRYIKDRMWRGGRVV
tara:strand:- start:443 stop:604 length:162 start_codon:yes stop_codon:yes gene_type:complete